MTEEVLEVLQLTGNEIQNLIRNFKKDSPSRKCNITYYQERLTRLQGLFKDFEATNAQVNPEDIPKGHEYFTQNYYSNICNVVQEYQALFQNELIKLEQSSAKTADVNVKSGLTQGAIKRTSTSEDHRHLVGATHYVESNDSITSQIQPSPNGTIRRFDARISAVERLIAGVATNFSEQPPQYPRIKREAIQKAWQHVEELYEAIWEQYEDPAAVGVDLDKYFQLEELVQNQLMQLSIPDAPAPITTSISATPTGIPLPKLTIPRFEGDYLKWSQFFDLFSHMVDKQPNVQKIYYLKSNVTGEAERLINHFAVTDENYSSAWTLLQERYNNKRVLATSLIQKLLNQPTETGSAGSIKALHDTTQECLLALNNIGIPTDTWDPLLLQLLVKKLDRETHMRYEQSISRPKELQTIHGFLSFQKYISNP